VERWYRNVKPARCVFVRKKSRIRSSQKSGDGILPGARAGRDISRNCTKARKGNKWGKGKLGTLPYLGIDRNNREVLECIRIDSNRKPPVVLIA
jgi:hypothetical protein